MARVAWIFTDLQTSATYNWEINPNSGGTPGINKNILFKSPAGANGQVIAMEGRDSVQEMSVSGVLLSEALYTAMTLWAGKRYPVMLTDDLGRQYRIYITGYTADRVRSGSRPWRHESTVEYIVLNEY